MTDATLTIRPDTGRRESAVVGVIAALLVALTVAYALSRPEQGAPPALLDWQVSAFTDLNGPDQAIHAELVAAGEEIGWYYQDIAAWPTLDELRDGFVSPFLEDAFWERNGSVQWERHLPHGVAELDQGATAYFGWGGTIEGQSAYLLLHRHTHAGFAAITAPEIWIHADPNVEAPDGFKAESLIRNGWRQVVTYSGTTELERLRGI